jgi:Flp pilus assembly protein TadD
MQKLQEAATHHPKDRDVAFATVKAQVTFQNWDAACKACEAALALDPENRQYTKSLGYCQARANRWDDAFGTLLRVMPEADARTFLGRTLNDLGRYDEGKQQFQMAIRLDPNHEVAAALLQQHPQISEQLLQQAGYTR